MKPKIAIDCDGVLTDTEKTWQQHYSRGLCGVDHGSNPPDNTWARWKNLCKKCFDAVLHREDVLYAHEPITYQLEWFICGLSKLADLHVVTSRPKEQEEITANWLFWKGLFPYFKGVHAVGHGGKREFLEQNGFAALLDDGPPNIIELQSGTPSSVVPVIFDAHYNQHLQGLRAYGWQDAYSILTDVAAQESVYRRLRV